LKDSGGGGGASALRAEPGVDRKTLEELYGKLNRREFVHPDPLELLYLYDDPERPWRHSTAS
jgi:hypothetical protein